MITEFEYIEGTPLYQRHVKCPICQNDNIFKSLRERIVVHSKLDEDFRTIKYKWVEKEHKKYKPLYFLLWTCKYCFYTDFSEIFYHSKHKSYLEEIKPFLMKLDDSQYKLTSMLGKEFLEHEEENFYKAVHQYFLALYYHSILPVKYKDYDKIGKIAIRLIWILRDEVISERSNMMQDFYHKTKTDFNKFKTNFLDLEKSYFDFLENSKTNIEKIKSDLEFTEKFFKDINRLHEFVDYIKIVSKSIDGDFNQFKEKHLSYLDLAVHSSYKAFPTFYDYLFHFKMYWQEMPATEEELVHFMVAHYDKAIQMSYYEEDLFKVYNIKKAIIFNLQQTRKYTDAITRCENTLLHLYKFHKVTMRKIDTLYGRKPNPKSEINKNYTIIKKIGEFSKYFHEKRASLIEALKRSEYAAAIKIIKETSELSEESLKKLLLKRNISEYTISEYFQYLRDKEVDEKKTGFFSFLKKLKLT